MTQHYTNRAGNCFKTVSASLWKNRHTGQSKRTILHWIERSKLQATKHGSTFQIALADLDHFITTHSPDVTTLLARVLAPKDLADVQASQAQRLSLLERRVFLLEQRLSLLEAAPRRRHSP